MLVAQLIDELEKLPAYMEVMIDVTEKGNMFKFKPLTDVGEIEVEPGQKYVALACISESEAKPQNEN